ncbi:MAG: threonylcarbamoyl-AMP synthase [Anaerolineaceae bacterium 4572_32.1]|nr:MAG: threonylcarbamoyl-AMP synthase [Anaerolineaceae bacterium 4572_32.1]
MHTQTLPVTDKSIAQAAHILTAGGLVAFPTDTVYGLGAHAFDAAAIEALYAAKERPLHKAIPVLIASAADLPLVTRQISPAARSLADSFWPGALTLVLPRHPALPPILTAHGDSLAVRVPDHPAARALITALNAPLAASSANISGQPSPVTADEAAAQIGGRIALILDGGPCPGGRSSTVLDLTRRPPRLLRPGPVTISALRAILPHLA